MKLFRYGDSGAEKPGLVGPDGTLRDLSARVGDIDGTVLGPDKLSELAGIDPTSLPVVEGSPRFGPPVNHIGKILAIGLNYADHAAETGQEMPREPVIFTKDEIADPQNLRLWLEVDGHRYQEGSTSTMVFGVSYLVSFVTQFMSLQPGDVIATGTPPGVGFGQGPPVFLQPGNRMRVGVEGLGEQEQEVVAYTA